MIAKGLIMIFKKKEKIKQEESILDEELFEYIQPAGGITFKSPNVITTGDGYIRVLHVYQLPKNIDDFWLDNIFNIEGAITTFDLHTKDIREVKKNINRSLKEEYSRERSATDYMEIYDAQQRKYELEEMLHELSSMGEVIKMVHFRIYVKGRNLIELDEKAESLMKTLESDSYMSAVLLNEQKREWQALFESYTQQHKKPFYMKALPMMTEGLAMGYPFNYSELIDEYGTLLGFTPVGGAVIFNEFTKTSSRKHYNSLVCGDMGSGKSTYLKKRFKANACEGNFIRTFDITGEFEPLTKEFGGKIIKCNGSEGILNPLEILKAGSDEDTSYTRHISKVCTFFKCIVPSADDHFILILENALREFYESYNLTPEEIVKTEEGDIKKPRQITGLSAKKYPIFTDFYKYLVNKLNILTEAKYTSEVDVDLAKKKARILLEITDATKSIVQNYGSMFDGHTSVDNIVDEKIVTFDISEIKDLGNVFIAQMFNMVSLCWDNAVSNGTIMKNLWETGQMDIRDITDFLILIDESHRWVNTSMPMILDLLIKYLREARKYFAGITFASQTVRDFMPEGESDPHINKIKALFELTQYKFMFRQDSSTLPLINRIFNNSLTFSQIEQIPYLDTGETILSIAGDRSLRFGVWLSNEYEEKIFAGGR